MVKNVVWVIKVPSVSEEGLKLSHVGSQNGFLFSCGIHLVG